MITDREKVAILKALPRDNDGDLILTPAACKDWLPSEDFDQRQHVCEAEPLARGFESYVLGMDELTSNTTDRETLAEYFEELRAFQLDFWQRHAARINAVVTRDWIDDYDDGSGDDSTTGSELLTEYDTDDLAAASEIFGNEE